MMTKNEKVRTALFVIVGVLVGFTIGISVDFPKTNESELAGTISKVDNYRNVKISEEDVKLRNELLTDTILYKRYMDYCKFQYVTAATMTSALETAIKASEGLADFKNLNGSLIEGLKGYYNNIGHSRTELMHVIAILNEIDSADPSDVYMAMQNANTAIDQMKYKDDAVISFIDEAGRYLKGKNGGNIKMLSKAYNHLLLVQGTKAATLKDKPKSKYLESKELMTSGGELNSYDATNVMNFIFTDTQSLKAQFPDSEINTDIAFSEENLTDVSNQLNAILVISSEVYAGCFMDASGSQLLNVDNLNMDQTGNLGAMVFIRPPY